MLASILNYKSSCFFTKYFRSDIVFNMKVLCEAEAKSIIISWDFDMFWCWGFLLNNIHHVQTKCFIVSEIFWSNYTQYTADLLSRMNSRWWLIVHGIFNVCYVMTWLVSCWELVWIIQCYLSVLQCTIPSAVHSGKIRSYHTSNLVYYW